jgi:hypothetical protein
MNLTSLSIHNDDDPFNEDESSCPTTSAILSPRSAGLLASPFTSHRKSTSRNFKSHIVSARLVDYGEDSNVSSEDVQVTIIEDESSTFRILFEEYCKTIFKSLGGNEALSRGLKEVEITGIFMPPLICSYVRLFIHISDKIIGRSLTKDHAKASVSGDTNITALKVTFLNVVRISFILAGSPSPPPTPAVTLSERFSDVRIDINSALSYRRYQVNLSLLGEKGVYDYAITSPEVSESIEEIPNQIFSELFHTLCMTSFASYHGEEALRRGLLRVIVKGSNQSDQKHNEALRADMTVSMIKFMFKTIGMMY